MSEFVLRQFRLPAAILASAWAIFIFYGSLLPFEFRSIPFESITRHFLGLGQIETQLPSLTDWVTNIAIFIPLGFFGLGASARGTGRIPTTAGMFITLLGCIIISVGIEFSQIFFPPRNSSILDVIANTLGTLSGIVGWLLFGKKFSALYQTVAALHQVDVRPPVLSKKLQTSLLTGSLLIILAWGGVFTAGWSGWGAAFVKVQSIHFLPFLEHQAADIFLAVTSTLLAALAYGSLGMALWLLNTDCVTPLSTKLRTTTILAMVLAFLMEGIKLFLVAKKPDTGNVIIASLTAGLGYFIAPWIGRIASSKSIDTPAVIAFDSHVNGEATLATRLLVEKTVALLCAFALTCLVVTYPLGQIPFAFALAVYGVILVRYPMAWLIVLPAMLPILDLAPWTGRYFFDEFDGFLLVTLLVGLWRAAGKPLTATSGLGFWLWVAAFSTSFLTSAVIGMLPLQPIDPNAFASPYSNYSSLRLAKMLLFTFGLAILLSHHVAAGQNVKRIFKSGILLGLACAIGSVIWERIAYAGLADFSKSFRVVGLFSTMNTGGPHLDAFLLSALPFALVLATRSRQMKTRIVAGILFASGTYAVMMTYSRAAVISLAIVVLIVVAWTIQSRKQIKNQSSHPGLKLVGSLALAGAVIAPVLFGSFMQARLSTTEADLNIRYSHWNEAINMMTDNWRTSLFGMGIGRYPETYQLLSRETNKPAMHRFETEADNTYLRIGQGATLYVEQIVSPAPRNNYQIALKARTQYGNGTLHVLLCDRTFLQGVGCQSATFSINSNSGQWQIYRATINSANVGENPLRVAKLSLENAGSSSPIDVDNIEMISLSGINLLANGQFQSGSDRWYFSSPNNFSPWRVENLLLHIYFEQGWFGLITFCLLAAAAVVRLAQLAKQGRCFATALLAALIGFLAVGGFDSMFDAPRLILVFGLMIAATGIVYAKPVEQALAKKPDNPPSEDHLPLPSPKNHRDSVVDALLSPALDWRKMAMSIIGKLLLLAVAIAVFTRLPFVPYNIRELPNPYHPFIAPLLLAAFVFWTFGVPAAIARWLAGAGNRGIWLPLIIPGHGLISWAILHFAVLPEAIHDVIGSPILQWPSQTEYIARFVPLVNVLTLQLVGGALLARAQVGRQAAAPLWWVLSAILLAPLQYWVIVSQAATDNLTELMANNASFSSFLLLSGYLLLIGSIGSLLAALRLKANPRSILIALTALIVSLPVGYLLLATGTASVIVKEQKAFSALQFLLSPDRAHYTAGFILWIRFSIAHLAAVFLIAFTQHSLWIQPRQRSSNNIR